MSLKTKLAPHVPKSTIVAEGIDTIVFSVRKDTRELGMFSVACPTEGAGRERCCG